MSSVVAISRTNHLNKSWAPRKGYGFAASRQVIPLLRAELAVALPHYVIGFVQDENSGFQLVALVGLGGSRNVYTTNDMQWLASYVPAELRKYPFSVIPGVDGQEVFCIEQAALSDDPTFPQLFDTEGKMTSLLQEQFNFVAQMERDRKKTAHIVKVIREAGLIEPWDIQINRKEQEPIRIKGLHRINEEGVAGLDADVLARLHNQGALPMIYAQIFSMSQLSNLSQRAEFLAKNQNAEIRSKGLENIFSEQGSGTLNFDALGE